MTFFETISNGRVHCTVAEKVDNILAKQLRKGEINDFHASLKKAYDKLTEDERRSLTRIEEIQVEKIKLQDKIVDLTRENDELREELARNVGLSQKLEYILPE
jgi:flagellar hook-basal body complex protein FliE